MPQLNPAPWFYMFSLMWFVLLTMKNTIFTLTPTPTLPPSPPTLDPQTWIWLWQ